MILRLAAGSRWCADCASPHPKLWLDESLMREVDRAALEKIAALRQRRRATEIELRPGRSLAELETALAPLLPTFARLG